MNSWQNNQGWYPPGYNQPPAPAYWQQPAPQPPTPAWHEPNLKIESFFTAERFKNRKHQTLHPILAADTTSVRFDARKSPSGEGIEPATFYAFRHAYATSDNVSHMMLISKDFPWSIDINARGNPITCDNIWTAIHVALQEPIVDSEWGVISVDKDRMRKVERAAKRRQEVEKDRSKKLKRIDWLMEGFVFKGLEKDEEFAKRRLAYKDEEYPEVLIVKMATS